MDLLNRQSMRMKLHWIKQLGLQSSYTYFDLEKDYTKLISQVDMGAIDSLNSKFKYLHCIETESAAKYTKIGYWLRFNLVRAARLGLHKSSPKRILDIGCGNGYFMRVAIYFGHEVIGVDIPSSLQTAVEQEVFSKLPRALNVSTHEYTVKKFVPIGRRFGTFDLVTCFLVCFNNHKKSGEWGVKEWEFFIEDISGIINAGGELFMQLNGNESSFGIRRFYDDQTMTFLQSVGILKRNEFKLFVGPRPID